ncbi:hypothetical protein B296_00051443 [Ensete ventricosum]|uniref:Uncharacterized protein n=1 Tax=Ensete ventricosum TaxID=4639 RepID=A0A426Y4I9_ENSVE|nr:hypothetical protein B296_00051443 [Ensete ventricosum]
MTSIPASSSTYESSLKCLSFNQQTFLEQRIAGTRRSACMLGLNSENEIPVDEGWSPGRAAAVGASGEHGRYGAYLARELCSAVQLLRHLSSSFGMLSESSAMCMDRTTWESFFLAQWVDPQCAAHIEGRRRVNGLVELDFQSLMAVGATCLIKLPVSICGRGSQPQPSSSTRLASTSRHVAEDSSETRCTAITRVKYDT